MGLFGSKRDRSGLDLALVMCPGWGAVQPPVGISYLKSFLAKHGIGVKCFDFSLKLYKAFPEKKYWDLNYPGHFIIPEMFERDILPFLEPFIDACAQEILSYNPKAVGFSLFMSSINTSRLLAERLKKLKPELVIVGGGAETTRVKRVIVDGIKNLAPVNKEILSAFDILIDGEGEMALAEVISLYKQGRDFHHVDGAYYASDSRIIVNRPRKLIEDLDVLDPPDFYDFELGDYTRRALPIVTSRGCRNRCTFCADSPLWKIYRHRSAEKVVEEIIFLIESYGINQFEIVDSTFNGDIQRVEEICDLIIRSKLDIQWSAKATLSEGMSYALLCKMKQAGCLSLAYGVESGSPRILRDMRKYTDLETAKKIIRATHTAGIQPNCFFIIGYPTETEEDFQRTLNFIEENAKFIHRFDQVTGCHIEEDSYLGLNLDNYGIVLKEDGWYSRDSTPQIRNERLERFRELARRLHSYYQCEVQL